MIVFDLQALQSESFGDRGIGRYVAELGRELATSHPGTVDVFAWNDARPWSARIADLDRDAGLGPTLRPFSDLRGDSVDLLHVNAPLDLLDQAVLAVPVRARRLVTTCYDLIPYRFPDVYLGDPATRARYVTRLAQLVSADAIVTDSYSASCDVVEMLGVDPERVTLIGGGVAADFVPPTTPHAERMSMLASVVHGLSDGYVLVPTGMDWRKNVAGVITAYGRLSATLRDRHQLVLTCKLDDGQRAWIERLAADAGCGDQVVVTGHVSDEVLVALYQTAELVVFPSFYEGFGLPVLEARSCGARVICSNVSALPEVMPEDRARFDPGDPDDIAEHMQRALTDADDKAMLDAVPDSGFSWREAARRLVGVYAAQTVAPSPSTGSSNRRRLGVVTILPPVASGVADHSLRLVQAIHDGVADVDVRVFTPTPAAVPPELDVAPLAMLPYDWEVGRLDAVLYCIGNDPIHAAAATMLPLVPGHALIHDVRLRRLRTPYAPASHAISVLVQSEHARRLVIDENGVDSIDVGPLHCEVVELTDALDDGGPPWVVSAGIAHELKRSDVVAAAFAELASTGVARAAIVGSGAERFAGGLEGVAAVERVDADEFDAWLRRAAVLVQLRATTNGESSGVVAQGLARGIPLVVSDIGAMAELSDDVAVRLPVDVTADELATAVRTLLADADHRQQMRQAALAFARRETPLAQGQRVVDAIFGRR